MIKSKLKTVVLLDAHAILHRGYHAMGGFATRAGKPTGALYGFITMVLRIYEDIKPDYIAACFDLPKPTFRHISYDGYKAGRSKTDDALITQIQEAYALCDALCIPIYKEEGFEADDLLGTLAEQLKSKPNTRVIIASGDMDTFQLIDDDVVTVYTLKKANEAALYTSQSIIDRFGFPPEYIPDYKGLSGDTSDNIIGIKGIGDKTATELIKRYGTIENMYVVLKKDRQMFLDAGFKERIVKLLEEGEEDALFSKTLATIRRDAKSVYVEPKMQWKDMLRIEKYQEMCDLYEFRSLRNRLHTVKGEEENKEEEVSVALHDLEELRVMVNLLHSEMTNAHFIDIQNVAQETLVPKVKEALLEMLHKENLIELFVTVEKPIIGILEEMQKRGITLDVDKLRVMSKDLHGQVKVLETKIHALAGIEFNIASPKQLGDVLYEKMGLGLNATGGSVASPDHPKGGLRIKIKKTKTGQKSTNVTELEKIQDEHEIVPLIISYRELSKLLSTYVDALPTFVKEDGKIHAHYIQTGAGTGRFSCEDPNLQNLPVKSELGQKVRGAFIAGPGKVLLSCDYAQIDLRAAAILSGDENLVEIFKNGIDVHTGTAARVFGVEEKEVTGDMRRKAKAINFGILYGMGVTALKEGMGVERKEAQDFFDQYKATFVRLMAYLEEVKADAWKTGYTKTLLGRRCEVPLLKSPLPFLRAQGERIAMNAPIQGTSADIVKLSMIDATEYFKEKKLVGNADLLLQIHDELIFEIDEAISETVANELVRILENVLKKRNLTDIPLVVSKSLGKNLEVI